MSRAPPPPPLPLAPPRSRTAAASGSQQGPVSPAVRPGPPAAPRPSLFGILASKRLAHQMARRVYARRAVLRPGAPPRRRREEPTYRCEPARKFNSDAVAAVVKETVDDTLRGFVYSGDRAKAISKVLAEAVKERVKQLQFERYKIVCCVLLGESREQALTLSSRCVWDWQLDTSATYNWQSASAFCSVTVYGIYHE